MNSEILLPLPELKRALAGLNKLVGRKPILPVLGHVRVSRQSDGVVTLQGTDLDAFATYTLNGLQPGEPVNVLVPLEQLNHAFKGSNASKQGVSVLCDQQQINLRYSLGGTPVEQPVNSLSVDEWPEAPRITVDNAPLEPGFGLALKQALASCSDDPTRHSLQGACLDAREESAHYVVGTDGRALFAANGQQFPFKDEVIIPDSRFLTGSGLLDQAPCSLAVQPAEKEGEAKYLRLQSGPWQFITREIPGQYPRWKQVIPTVDRQWARVELRPAALEQLLKVLPNLPGKETKHSLLRLRVAPGLMVEGRQTEESDWTTVAISDVVITGKPQVICLDRRYLASALEYGLDELHIFDELSPLVASKGGKKMVIMPVATAVPAAPVAPAANQPTKSINTPAAPTVVVNPQPQPEPKTENITMTATEQTKPTETPAAKAALDRVETIKHQLRDLLAELTDLAGTLRSAEKEKRNTEKEIASVRQTIRSLQGVRI